jgi:hypothetical protein
LPSSPHIAHRLLSLALEVVVPRLLMLLLLLRPIWCFHDRLLQQLADDAYVRVGKLPSRR